MNEGTLARLEQLAAYFQTTSEGLWEVLLRVGFARGVAYIAMTLILVAVVPYTIRSAMAWDYNHGEFSCSRSDGAIGVVCGIVGFVAFVCSLLLLLNGIVYIFAPEAYAIDTIRVIFQ